MKGQMKSVGENILCGAMGFIQWIEKRFNNLQEFRPLTPGEVTHAENFNLCYKRTGSLIKGNQWYLFKALPTELTTEEAYRLAEERNLVVKGKRKLFKWLMDFMVFIYISEKSIPREVLDCLGKFYSVKKEISGNVQEINFLFEISTGQYTQPKRTGFVGWIPLKRLIEDAQQHIFEPYRQWVLSSLGTGEQIAAFCQKCGQRNPEKQKFCGSCGASLVLP